MDWLLRPEQYWVRRYVRSLRQEEFYTFYKKNRILQYYYRRKKNLLGARLGFFISAGCFDGGLKIYHYGSIIVNPKSRIGKNCTIHGNCCIGSKGVFPDDSPVIGNNVDIGQNAQILGGITIADGVRIGAGAVVTKSIPEPNVTVVGIPARIVYKN
jgi:serine O-acetyltransferase